MAVYVDNMNAQYGRMKMCHLLADTEDELLAMVDRIGVARRWHQFPGTVKSHFDICLSMREKAIAAGAIEIEYPGDVARIMRERRVASSCIDQAHLR
ncbi:TPA: DUF4031 domain-containing protein [Pseudomonas aeruginosa]|nr:DUF4031 domain-containing protein [Pseudomonas aeruginosa]